MAISSASLMPYLQEQPNPIGGTYVPVDQVVAEKPKQKNQDVSWLKSQEGKDALEGAAIGAKSGDVGSTLVSSGIASGNPYIAGAGLVLGAVDQAHQVDYANKKMAADQQQAAHSAQVAGLYRMMGQNYSTVG